MSDTCFWPRCPCKSTGIKCQQQQDREIQKSGRTKIRPVSEKVALKKADDAKTHQKDIAFYYSIWMEREHVCQNCGAPIYQFLIIHYHHILAKRDKNQGGYPQYRYCKWNIWILCWLCHDTNDNGNPDSKTLVKLRAQYYKLLSLHENRQLEQAGESDNVFQV